MKDEFQHVSGAPSASSWGQEGAQLSGAPSAMDLPLPEDLQRMLTDGDYVVEAFLGQGGMGAVYKGLQMPLRRPVAIKILQRRQSADDYHFEDRFRREAYAMASLTHPNVVQVYDCGDAGDNFLFISMELVEGGDLNRAMKNGQVTPTSAIQLFTPICEGVQAAHEHGLVHRDIKPANIFLTNDSRPKVADFGLAKRFDAQSTFMTKTGLGMGTPDYAAPEQYEELADLDHRADIYSLGVMFYQMLTGHLPRGAYKPPSRLVEVDPRLDGVVQKAMQNDRAERYQRVEEMKCDVEHIVATWMRPPKPRVVTPGNLPPRTTGRVPTCTGRVPTLTGQVPTHAPHGSHTSHVPTATGRVPVNPRTASVHTANVPSHPHPSPAAQGETLAVPPAGRKSGPVMLAGLLATAVLIGGGAFLFLGREKPVSERFVESVPADTSSSPSPSLAPSIREPVARESNSVSLPPLPVRPALQNVDLLSLTDPARDRVSAPGLTDKNEWYREGVSLSYKADGKSGRIAAPVALECRDYELELRVERLAGTGRIHLNLPVNRAKSVPLILNDPNRRILNEKDGAHWPGHAAVTHVTVRVARDAGSAGDRLVLRDKTSGKVLLDWQGQLTRLGRAGEVHPEFPGNPVTSLLVVSDPYTVRTWRLRVFEGTARVLRTVGDKPPFNPTAESSGRVATVASTTPAPPLASSPAATLPSTIEISPPTPPAAPVDARLAQLEAGFKARYDADAHKPYAAALATLNEGYLRALATARAAAQRSGNLMELTAIDEEAARTKSGKPPPPADVEDTPESLIKLRGTYRSAMARHVATRDKAAAPLYGLYVRALDVYIAELTKANKITRAREVQDLRSKIAAQKPVIDSPAVAEAAPNSRSPVGARGAPFNKAVDQAAAEVTASSSWRQLAAWVLSLNGQLVAERDGARITVSPANAKELPSGKFSVRHVYLTDPAGNARLTDDDLTLLANAPDLEYLDIRDAPEITRLPALRGLKKLERIVLHRSPKVNPSLFAGLAGKQNLADVDLYGSLTTIEGISALASCPKLTSLNVGGTLLNDASLAEIGKLKSVRLLQLGNTAITDESLPSLAALTSLEALTLDGCGEIRGRTLSSLTQVATLKQLNLRNVRLNTEHIPVIGRFVSLELLALDGMAGIDDEALAGFGNLPRLQSLMLYGTNVTGTGLVSMKASKELRQLNLGSKAPVTNDGLHAIAANFPKLVELSLGDGGTWDANGLKALASLEYLKSLFAQGANGCGEKELEVISEFKQLDSLSLPYCSVKDAGLARLSSLKLLSALDLGGAAAIGDGAISTLGKLRGLRSLQLRGTAVTEGGVVALKKQLPNANIAR